MHIDQGAIQPHGAAVGSPLHHAGAGHHPAPIVRTDGDAVMRLVAVGHAGDVIVHPMLGFGHIIRVQVPLPVHPVEALRTEGQAPPTTQVQELVDEADGVRAHIDFEEVDLGRFHHGVAAGLGPALLGNHGVRQGAGAAFEFRVRFFEILDAQHVLLRHPVLEHEGHESHHQQQQRAPRDGLGQQHGVDGGATGDADGVGREMRGGHGHVVHRGHRRAQGQRGQGGLRGTARRPGGHPQGGRRQRESAQQRQRQRPQVVADAGLDLHGGHATEMHGANAPGLHRTGRHQPPAFDLWTTRLVLLQHPQHTERGQHGRQDRGQGDAQVVGDRHRQLESQHADEMHRPDAHAHEHAATDTPTAPLNGREIGHGPCDMQEHGRSQGSHCPGQDNQRRLKLSVHKASGQVSE